MSNETLVSTPFSLSEAAVFTPICIGGPDYLEMIRRMHQSNRRARGQEMGQRHHQHKLRKRQLRR